jgi:Tetrahydromethanopterin S-methyltransferase, subunit A
MGIIQQTPETALVNAKIEDERRMVTMIGKDTRMASGLWVGFVKGFSIGIFSGFILLGLKFFMG